MTSLSKDDYCALVTKNGQLIGLLSHDYSDFWKNADEIQELMSIPMKKPYHRENPFLWIIKKNRLTIEGYFLDEE